MEYHQECRKRYGLDGSKLALHPSSSLSESMIYGSYDPPALCYPQARRTYRRSCSRSMYRWSRCKKHRH
ncbi:Uncharacterised protein [Vibrio cholerae]|nr:Uncharacterised protein [Vibrio cholerae]